MAFSTHFLLITNLQHYMDTIEIRRRERVIRIFPNEEAALRLIGALMVEQHEKWITDQKYFNMDEYLQWRNKKQDNESQNVTALWK